MCTSIVEIARAEGMAKRGDEWFPLSQAVIAYDHARHAPLGDVITLDFINTDLGPGARAGIELTLETAKELRAALDRAITAAEFEEAEVRGKGRLARSRSSCVTSEPRSVTQRAFARRHTAPEVAVAVADAEEFMQRDAIHVARRRARKLRPRSRHRLSGVEIILLIFIGLTFGHEQAVFEIAVRGLVDPRIVILATLLFEPVP